MSSGSSPGRPKSQPCPKRAPRACATASCSSVSMPSASSTAPERSDCALTAWTMAAIAGEGLSCTSRRSSLMTSGAMNGISASERWSAPTSSSAIRQPAPPHRLDAREHLGGLVGQRALRELDDDVELRGGVLEQGDERRRHVDVEQRRLDVDEQGLAQARIQGALERGGAAGPLELRQQPARAGRLEQQVGPLQRRTHRSTGEGFVRDDLTRVEVDDRLVQGADEATIKDLAQLGGECGLLKQDRGHLPV